ncbi:hypothetical protein CON42_12280 [Bacillus thuringiensis]|nr:hypothetical protein AT266_07745 [Bacillus cereus]MBG9753549.1 hypothetical protein [Bacillus thuringiensis]OTZ87542.1 hypothetical protein BK771_12810 [Bacillus thuringiensis serovar ostriniae]MBG9777638.1 hypothetical protein [Bacillus thuringiensis]MBG9926503.1 hypothetical protein [Bacillus thuringiensis]
MILKDLEFLKYTYQNRSVVFNFRVALETHNRFRTPIMLFIFLYIPILAWVAEFPFFTELAEKLYKILHALSVFFSKMLAVPHRYQLKKLIVPQNEKNELNSHGHL